MLSLTQWMNSKTMSFVDHFEQIDSSISPHLHNRQTKCYDVSLEAKIHEITIYLPNIYRIVCGCLLFRISRKFNERESTVRRSIPMKYSKRAYINLPSVQWMCAWRNTARLVLYSPLTNIAARTYVDIGRGHAMDIRIATTFRTRYESHSRVVVVVCSCMNFNILIDWID